MKKLSNLTGASVVYLFPAIALILSLFAKETSEAARTALYLCLDVVIPSLFPFFVLSRLAVPYLSGFSCPAFLKYLTGKFFRLPYYTLVTILLGYLSGYPTGAKLARDMFDERVLDSRQASKMIAVANNSSPLFIIGTIGAGLFKSIKIGFLLLAIHWISGIIAAFFIVRLADTEKSGQAPSIRNSSDHKREKPARFLLMIPSAIEESAILCLKLTGYIVLFAVLTELLSRLGLFSLLGQMVGLFCASSQPAASEFISAVLRGLMEITSGAQAISRLNGIAVHLQLAAVSLIVGFAGFSVHMQIMGIMKDTQAKYRTLFAGKLLHGIIAFFITLAVTTLAPMTVETANITFGFPFNFSGIRLFTVGLLLISLVIAPYQSGNRRKKQTIK
ncbi:MAG TPA: hypothetical protein DD738_03365 [Ruminiclostridium sp.]|nr:hypothetical protein [Ruminiclostridium sp.]